MTVLSPTPLPPPTGSPKPSGARRVGLALGSGGARGYAHIGVIEVLEERGFEIAGVAGSSMGAVVGGLYCAGQLDRYTEWVGDLSQLDVLRLLDVSLSAPGAFRAERILARLRTLVGSVAIEDLPVPFTAVATDLLARKAVWFRRGPLDIALRASMAIPGVFTPVVLGGRLLVDGGLMEPVPVAPISSADADATIAVDLGGERVGTSGVVSPLDALADPSPVDEWLERFRGGAARLLDREMIRSLATRLGRAPGFGADQDEEEEEEEEEEEGTPTEPSPADLPTSLRALDVMSQSIEAMHAALTRVRLAENPPDVLITVPRDACRSRDFHRSRELIGLGRILAAEALDAAGLTAAR